jgi:hypothetical protein
MDELGGGGRLYLWAAWSGVLCCGLRMAVMFVGGGEGSAQSLSPWQQLLVSMRAQGGWSTSDRSGALRFGERKRGDFFGGRNGWYLVFLLGLGMLTMARVTQWLSSSPILMLFKQITSLDNGNAAQGVFHFFSCMLLFFRLLLVVYHHPVTIC